MKEGRERGKIGKSIVTEVDLTGYAAENNIEVRVRWF